jgi:hypothetical protein
MCFTLLNLEIFNFKNVKNKKCVHTWANSTGYTSLEIIEMDSETFFFFFNHMSLKRQDFGIFYHGTNEGAGSLKANSNT